MKGQTKMQQTRKVAVGVTLALALSIGAAAAVAVAVGDDGTVPAKITNTGPERGKDRAYDEAIDTGYMPVIGRDGARVGVIDWKQWSTPDRPAEVVVYDKSPAAGGKPIGTFGPARGLVVDGVAK